MKAIHKVQKITFSGSQMKMKVDGKEIVVNLTKVSQIASCGTSKFTRIIFENQTEIIINGKFDAVKMEIKRQLKNEEA